MSDQGRIIAQALDRARRGIRRIDYLQPIDLAARLAPDRRVVRWPHAIIGDRPVDWDRLVDVRLRRGPLRKPTK